MAKQGTITAPTGADENLKTLGDATPVRDTLAGVIRSALQLATALKKAIVNFGVRKAVIVPSATDVSTVTATQTYLGSFAKDDPSKASSPMTFTGGGNDATIEDALTAMTTAVKPSLSVEALTNRIDDLSEAIVSGDLVGANEFDGGLVLIQDQGAQLVHVYLLEDAAAAAAANTAAVALAEDVQYVQTLTPAGAAQFGE